MANLQITDGKILVSFDVVSLFTNVPLDFTLDIIDRKWSVLEPHMEIDKDSFLNLIRFCVHECSLITQYNILYRQLDGLQMGSQLAPILSDIFLEELFDTLLPEFPVNPDFLFKYVDDTICSLPLANIDSTLSLLNSFHPKIQFTVEVEKDGSLPFLDVSLIRGSDNKITTNWYRKPTSTDSVLNYLSSHPHYQKMNVACNLTKRVLQLSDKQFHGDNINKIKNTLYKSNYPLHLVNKIIHKSNHQVYCNNNSPTEQPPSPFAFQQQPQSNSISLISQQQSESNNCYSSLTYIPTLSDNIQHLIKNNNPTTKIAFQPNKTLKNNLFTNPKQKISKLKHSNVIYKIDCREDRCQTSYIGETKRQLEIRKTEHERDYRNRYLPTPKTGLINHTLETGHQFDFDNIKIIDRESNQQKRRIIESAHVILNSPNTCNLKQDTNNINNNYLNTLNIYKTLSPNFKKRFSRQVHNNNSDDQVHSITTL